MFWFGGFGGGRRRGGFGGRWIIALIIAGIGLFTYFNKSEVNPVTGKKQYIAMNVDQEKALGLRAAPEMAAQMGGAVDPARDPAARLVADVGRRLVSSSDASKSPYVGNFNFHLLNDSKMINAFALPGGQIFITRALFDRLENEAQLAGVLGHEIGHVIGRHSAEQMAKGRLGQMLTTAIGVGASGENGGQGAYMATAMANQMLQLKYGRGHETESDSLGLGFMEQAGYDPSAMMGVMKVLAEASKTRQPELLASHPHPESRIETIKEYLAKNHPNGIPDRLSKGQPLLGAAQPARGQNEPAARERIRF